MSTLTQIAAQHPFPAYQTWWPLGHDLVRFMSQAIVSEWEMHARPLAEIHTYAAHYTQAVYARETSPEVLFNFVAQKFPRPFSSGEFDAISYAFYRSAFEQMAQQNGAYNLPLEKARREFTKRVGRKFFIQLHDHLRLKLPAYLDTDRDFVRLQENIHLVGKFLLEQGYLREHFAFSFDVHLTHAGQPISQTASQFLQNLAQNGVAYALYEMGYPIILPSAVYLYHTLGEAQHHSSRTIEELFARVGCTARETDDFDPTDFPADRVVELWEIKVHQSRIRKHGIRNS
ncbi:MAG: hypothetical protein Fur0022_43820 [Anaerolineales bacterium]